ncbi:FadR family transcriptional regulator [Rossellomorea vietnamensis]|uniref:FadR family transcriptional regulator n=1 Tax=Rossellomorea vietnamensis TaxID=218284 RepID=A0A5D4M8B2_9BACI|nr:GntR family transcriptional regulator [Rossellomorea vietnamensis]TYR97902.1 FadR family transcriptional regulator [Rossellomorea vietnamensis]
MDSPKPNSKVFIEIVNRIREMISVDGLQPGDKIPSERELSERLKAGRSSIREALRALELLGLIETRRGEGTFLKDFRNHHLVELLGTFILKDGQAKGDVLLTKEWLEKESLRTILDSGISLEGLQNSLASREHQTVDSFLREVILQSGNLLAGKIWYILSQYGAMVESAVPMDDEKQKVCEGLIDSLRAKRENEMWEYYHTLKNTNRRQ